MHTTIDASDASDASGSDLRWRRSLPPGADWQQLAVAGGASLRTVRWPAASDRPTILFLNGRADFIEKYAEAYWRWRRRGYGIVTFDWRGQGRSDRFAADASGWFDRWLDDLDALIAARATVGGRLLIAGHSMGGHLALRHLARDRPQLRFERVMLFAPMAGIAALGVLGLLDRAARLAVRVGCGAAFPPGQSRYGPRYRSVQRQRRLTSDPQRFADEGWWIDRDRRLASDGATWCWIAEALASCRALAAPGVVETITLPVDVFMGSAERLVDVGAAEALTRRLPNGTWHRVAGGAHELLRERTDIQTRLHADIDRLIGGDA